MMDEDDCPNDGEDPDHCDQCHGWGHLCPRWRETHPADVAMVKRVYASGWDPTRFYPSVEAARKGEQETARARGKL